MNNNMLGRDIAIWLLIAFLMQTGCESKKVLQETFDTDPRSRGWMFTDWDLEVHNKGGWSARFGRIGGGLTIPDQAGVLFWRSAKLEISPLTYFKIEFYAKGRGKPFVAGVSLNSEALYGRYPHKNQTRHGLLVADDWTAFKPSDNWVKRTYVTRSRVNAAFCAVRLQGTDVHFDDVTVTKVQREEVLRWADNIYRKGMPALSYAPPKNVIKSLPRTAQRLQSGKTTRIVMLGDSIMNDIANSTVDVLLEREYPGTNVKIIAAVGGGTGVDKWNDDSAYNWPDHDLDLQKGVIAQRPDLVIVGGVSNGENYSDFYELVDKIVVGVEKGFGYTPDIMLMTGALGKTTDPPGYSAKLKAVAEEKDTAFLDIRKITEQYLQKVDAKGYSRNYFYRDDIHANHYGKQLLGRVLTKCLSQSRQ